MAVHSRYSTRPKAELAQGFYEVPGCLLWQIHEIPDDKYPEYPWALCVFTLSDVAPLVGDELEEAA